MRKTTIALFCILLCAAIVRIYHLHTNPPGFFCDEASIGYNAYTILTTGKDEYGVRFPLFFQAFGEYKNPVDIYLTIPFVQLFGLSVFSVRLSSVVMSLLTVLSLYFLGKRIHSPLLGLLMAAVFAFTPWDIHLARTNMEGMQHLLFFLSIALIALTYKDKRSLILFSLASAVATYCYFPARIVVPLFVMGIIVWKFFSHKRNHALMIGVIYGICMIPLGIHMFFGGMNRWNEVSGFGSDKNYAQKIAYSYLLHFSPDFLFLKGDIDMSGQFITRHSLRGLGELQIWQAPMILMGIWWIMKRKEKIAVPVLLLLFLFPLPSSLTSDVSPQATRAVIGLIPLSILTAFGLLWTIEWVERRKKWLQIMAAILGIVLFAYSEIRWVRAFTDYPTYAADYWGWQYGAEEILTYFRYMEDKYDELYLEAKFNEPESFISFFIPSPQERTNILVGDLQSIDSTERQLFAISAETFNTIPDPDSWIVHHIVKYPNGSPAFYLISSWR